MTDADLPAFLQRLVAVGELYQAPLSETTQELYFEALKDLPLSRVVAAMNTAVRACRFFPKPVELRDLAVGTPDEGSEVAWLRFKRAMRTVGGYLAPGLADDPALVQTIAEVFGGWEKACWTDFSPEMWASKRKEFGRVYGLFKSGVVTVAVPATLTGFTDRGRLPDGARLQRRTECRPEK